MNEQSLEQELRRRFVTRTERFAHGAFAMEVLLPRSAEDLIDVSEFNVDERLPYWADLWPSARALTRLLLEAPLPGGRVIELGAGVALPSLALGWRGVEVLATDYYPEALQFAQANAERNGIGPLPTLLLDWRHPPAELGGFELVLAADVLYERRNADALAGLLPHLVAPGGRALIADPGRVYAGEFRRAMQEAGWRVEVLTRRKEPSPGVGEGVVSEITMWECHPPA